MQALIAADRDELTRLADDGCPHGDDLGHDLDDLWLDLGGSD